MKITHFLFALFLSSIAVAQTTEKEYTYFSKYYAEDLESGRDIKSGYKIESVNRSSTRLEYKLGKYSETKLALREIKIYTVIRESDNYKCGILVEFIRRDTKYKVFSFLINDDSDKELLTKSESDFYKPSINTSEDTIKMYHYLWNSINIIKDIYLN